MTPTRISATAATVNMGRSGMDGKTEGETVLVNREEKKKKRGVQHEDSKGVTHPSTTLAQARLTAEF